MPVNTNSANITESLDFDELVDPLQSVAIRYERYIVSHEEGCHLARVTQDRLPNAEFYEDKAATLRRLASQTRDDSVKRQLLLIAFEFEKLAERARRFGRTAAVD
jgi:hypothetical protein